MTKHFVQAAVTAADDELIRLLKEAEEGLLRQYAAAPPEVKPLYLVAVQNLRGLADTNASQQNLIVALKTIQDITGMKAQQATMLAFARHAFQELPSAEPAGALPSPTPAIPMKAGDDEVVVAEVVG